MRILFTYPCRYYRTDGDLVEDSLGSREHDLVDNEGLLVGLLHIAGPGKDSGHKPCDAAGTRSRADADRAAFRDLGESFLGAYLHASSQVGRGACIPAGHASRRHLRLPPFQQDSCRSVCPPRVRSTAFPRYSVAKK